MSERRNEKHIQIASNTINYITSQTASFTHPPSHEQRTHLREVELLFALLFGPGLSGSHGERLGQQEDALPDRVKLVQQTDLAVPRLWAAEHTVRGPNTTSASSVQCGASKHDP